MDWPCLRTGPAESDEPSPFVEPAATMGLPQGPDMRCSGDGIFQSLFDQNPFVPGPSRPDDPNFLTLTPSKNGGAVVNKQVLGRGPA